MAVVVGCGLPALPEPAQLALALAVALPVVVLITRQLLRLGTPSRTYSAPGSDAGPAVAASDYRLARWFTYLGFGTLAILTLRPTPALTLSDWIFLAALVAAIVGYMHDSRGIGIAPPRLMLAGAAMVLIGALLSLPNAVDGPESLAVVARFLYLTVGWFALAAFALRNPRDVSIATLCWVASVALSGAAAMAQLLWGDIIPGTVIAPGRMTGFAQHVTDLGGMCAIALIPAVSVLDIHGLSAVRRIAGSSLVALVLGGLLLSGSVDGLVSAAIGFLLWTLIGGAGRRSLGVLLGLAVLSVFVAGTMAQLGLILPGARIASVLSGPADPSGSATFYARLEGFRQAWQWIQVSPLFGHGFDQASAITATGGDLIHNTLIATWFGGGVLALIGIVCVLLSAAGTARSAWANAKSSESRRLAAALFAAVGSAITFSMANPILFQRYVWVPIFLAIALASDQSRTSIPARRVEVAAGGGAERARMSARLSA